MEGFRAANMQAPCNAGQVLSGPTHPHACTDSEAPLPELSHNLTPGAARGTRNKHLHDHVCVVDGIHSKNCQADRDYVKQYNSILLHFRIRIRGLVWH